MKYLSMLAICLLCFASCTKNDDPAPDNNNGNNNQTANKTIDAGKLLAKWEVVSNYQLGYDASGNVISADGASQTFHEYGITSLPPGTPATYITFNSGNTFDLTDGNGNAGGVLLDYLLPHHGQWLLKNSNGTLNFETTTPNETIDYECEEFKDDYIHLTYTSASSNAKIVFHLEFKK